MLGIYCSCIVCVCVCVNVRLVVNYENTENFIHAVRAQMLNSFPHVFLSLSFCGALCLLYVYMYASFAQLCAVSVFVGGFCQRGCALRLNAFCS